MVERRRHKRYPMPRGTFVILRDKFEALQHHAQMSIGEIAMVLYKSQPRMMGQVRELSMGGLTVDGEVDRFAEIDDVELDLLLTRQGIYLHNLPFAAVPSIAAGKGKKKAPPVRTDAVQFRNLDDRQKGQLRELLNHHTG